MTNNEAGPRQIKESAKNYGLKIAEGALKGIGKEYLSQRNALKTAIDAELVFDGKGIRARIKHLIRREAGIVRRVDRRSMAKAALQHSTTKTIEHIGNRRESNNPTPPTE